MLYIHIQTICFLYFEYYVLKQTSSLYHTSLWYFIFALFDICPLQIWNICFLPLRYLSKNLFSGELPEFVFCLFFGIYLYLYRIYIENKTWRDVQSTTTGALRLNTTSTYLVMHFILHELNTTFLNSIKLFSWSFELTWKYLATIKT